MTAEAVSGLRAMLSLEDADPGLLETIGELSVTSDRSAPCGHWALSGPGPAA